MFTCFCSCCYVHKGLTFIEEEEIGGGKERRAERGELVGNNIEYFTFHTVSAIQSKQWA